MRHPLKVCRDPSDRISALRIITLMCLFAPLAKMIYEADAISLDPRPITNLIYRSGDWALIFLFVALALKPLSGITRFKRLLDVRRMIGVGAFHLPSPISPFILSICGSMGRKLQAKSYTETA